jgi:putative hydrolase of the HAD superfamily
MNPSERVWLFDLDNTLHDANPHIFPRINQAMTDYVAAALGLPQDEAGRLRVDYWQRYGATLTGLMRHHGTDPGHFLRETHQFPHLERLLVFERGLATMLRRLPGRKVVFSNAPAHYAEAVLRLMGIRHLFDAVYAIEHLRFQPKPRNQGFRRLLHGLRVRPERCVMVEDSVENLATARRLKMKTVLIRRGGKAPPWISLRLQSVLDLPRHLGRF